MGKGHKIVATLLALCFLMGCGSEPAVAVVPDVVEADKDTAVAVLMEQGFVPIVKETADPSVTIGTVLCTDPPAGSYVAVGGKVYLFVAADTATTTPQSTTTAPLSTTSTPQVSPSTAHLSTSLHLTTTTDATPTTSASWADPCATGHSYTDGICTACGAVDPHFVPILSLGQTWTVENQWSFTLLSVTAHSLCNPVYTRVETLDNQRVVTIRYTYENLGFVSDNEPLLFDATTFSVTAENGAKVPSYACLHEVKAVACAVGESYTAEETYMAEEDCRRITLQVTLRAADGRGVQRVRYLLDLP